MYATKDSNNQPYADEYTQGVYFLRAQLLNATSIVGEIENDFYPIGWSASLYYNHTYDAVQDIGFFNKVDAGQTSDSRHVRIISRYLSGEESDQLGLNHNAKLIQPPTIMGEDQDNWVYCSWKNSNEKIIHAIWRFEKSEYFAYFQDIKRHLVIPGTFYQVDDFDVKYFNFVGSDVSFVSVAEADIDDYIDHVGPIRIDDEEHTLIEVFANENPVFLIEK